MCPCVAGALPDCETRGSGEVAKSSIPAKVRAELLVIARSQAASWEESHPYDIQAVLTTQRQAERLEGEGRRGPLAPARAGGPQVVYFIAMKGTFRSGPYTARCHGGPAPCVPKPVLMLTLSAPKKQRLVDNPGTTYPNLKSAGTAVLLAAETN
jgi:hypothetical protein